MLDGIISAGTKNQVINLRVAYYGILFGIITFVSVSLYVDHKRQNRMEIIAQQSGEPMPTESPSMTKDQLRVYFLGLTGIMMVIFRNDLLKYDPYN